VLCYFVKREATAAVFIKESGPVLQHNERNACTVITVSNGAGLPYHVAHEMMAKAGRQPRHRFYFSQWVNFGCSRAEVRKKREWHEWAMA
jgi:hypothetical protein